MDATGAGAALFTFSDVVHIVTFVLGIALQGVGLTWWLSRQLSRRDQAIAAEASKRMTMQTQMTRDIARIDKDIATLKVEITTRLSLLPTRDAIEALLTQRTAPMAADLRTMVIELARMGIDVTVKQRG